MRVLSHWRVAALTLLLTLTCGPAGAAAPTQADLVADATTPQDVVTYGMGLNVNRFSPLKQINTDTVG
jgi:alcohol dehydrogenase (cytochrome c)